MLEQFLIGGKKVFSHQLLFCLNLFFPLNSDGAISKTLSEVFSSTSRKKFTITTDVTTHVVVLNPSIRGSRFDTNMNTCTVTSLLVWQ